MKINLGCGPNGQIDGFINIDNSKAVLLEKSPLIKKILYKFNIITKEKYEADWTNVMFADVSRRIPFKNDSIKKIYTSHFLEHLPKDKGQSVLVNCYRILKDGGVIRIVLPDLLWHVEQYIKSTKVMIKKEQNEFNSDAHDSFLNNIYGAYLTNARYGLEHCYMYDVPTIVCILRDVGFRDIEICDYQKGRDMELASYDSRPNDSMHIQCYK